MWKGRPFFRTRNPGSLQETQQFGQTSQTVPEIRRANSQPELANVEMGASEWYQRLSHGDKQRLRNLVLSFVANDASFQTIVGLVSQKFSIGERLSREVVRMRRQEDAARFGINPTTRPGVEDVKSPSSNSSVLRRTPRETPHKPMKPAVMLKNWERMAVGSRHSYKDEVFKHLLIEEKRQATAWHIVREGVASLAVFAPVRKKCVECIINFSVKYKLQAKSTEASFIQLYRFLLLPAAQKIVRSSSGLKGALGKYSLLAVAMCILMISAKYEEIYPPVLSVFVGQTRCTPREFVKLERRLLHSLNWNLVTSTPVDFLGRFTKSVRAARKTSLLARFILEASWHAEMAIGTDPNIFQPSVKRWLQTGRFGVMPTTVLMVAKPSEVALGCLILSLAYQGKVCYPVTLEYCSRVRAGFVSEVVEGLHEQLRKETRKHVSKPSAIVMKYSLPKYQNIGTFKPPTFRELLEHNAFRGTELARIYNQPSNISSIYHQRRDVVVL